MSEVTRILHAIDQGDPQAADRLLPLVYDELRRLASQKLGHESPGHTLQPTALVHEAYIRLVDVDQEQHWDGRRHFFAAAAEAMRRILVESARRKQRKRHGGELHRQELHENAAAVDRDVSEVLALDEALAEFAAVAPEKAELVKLRYFAGLSQEQAAETLGISRATAARYWTYARTWLYRRIQQ